MCVAVIDRCIPSVFDKIADLLDAVRSADRQYNLTTAVDETVTGEGLEKGLLYVCCISLCGSVMWITFPHVTTFLLSP